MIAKNNITGIILSGGQSSRMGTDKGLLPLKGRLFMEYIIAAISPLVQDMIIVSDNSDYDEFGLKRVNDLYKDTGPLGGLYTGLYHSETDYNMVLSCDVPMIRTRILERLIADDNTGFDVVQLRSEHRTMPLIALYQKKCMDKCLELLETGERRLRRVVDQFHVKTLDIEPELEGCLKNINTIEQLIAIQNAVEH
jgi:molybdopterin-guanine dinucleotide biosynthesis protein A